MMWSWETFRSGRTVIRDRISTSVCEHERSYFRSINFQRKVSFANCQLTVPSGEPVDVFLMKGCLVTTFCSERTYGTRGHEDKVTLKIPAINIGIFVSSLQNPSGFLHTAFTPLWWSFPRVGRRRPLPLLPSSKPSLMDEFNDPESAPQDVSAADRWKCRNCPSSLPRNLVGR